MLNQQDEVTVGKSINWPVIRGEPRLNFQSEGSITVHQRLVAQLVNQSWQVVLETPKLWYQVQLKRRV
jgi:protein gp37